MRFPRGRDGLRSRLLACTVGAAMVLSLVPAPALAEAIEELAPIEAEQGTDEAPGAAGEGTSGQKADAAGDSESTDITVVGETLTDDGVVPAGDNAVQADEKADGSDGATSVVNRGGNDTKTTDNTALRDGESDGIGTWSALRQAVEGAPEGTPTTITLAEDIKADKGASRILVSSGQDVTIDLAGHTIDRLVGDTPGGRIFTNRGSLTLTGNGILTGGDTGAVEYVPASGGAIYNDPGAYLTLDGCTIKGMGARAGGAIYNAGTLTIKKATLSNNCAQGYHASSSTEIGGGAIYNVGTVYMQSGSIEGNVVGDDSGDAAKGGYGVYNGGTFVMNGGSIKGNKDGGLGLLADHGGGGVYNDGTFEMHGGDISNNSITESGGGVLNASGGTFVMTGGKISGNITTWSEGAGIWNTGTMNVSGGEISGNKTEHVEALITFSHPSIGGIYNGGNGTLNLSDCKVSNNYSEGLGGGICIGGGVATFERVSITGNTSGTWNDAKNGGGVYISGGTLTMKDVTISGNKANGGWGGGIYIGESAEVTLNGGTITNNTSKNNGGGVHFNGGKLSLVGAPKVYGNKATEALSQDLHLADDKYVTFSGALTDGANVRVGVNGDGGRVFTSGYSESNPNEPDPSKFFGADARFQVADNLIDGEAHLFETPTTWAGLGELMSDMEGPGHLKLTQDYTALSTDDPLVVPEGRSFTIDLNGHTLNRDRQDADQDGCAIVNNGTLTMSKGTVKGGDNSGDGGGILNNGTLSLDGVGIVGNYAANGGGIANKGSMTLKDVELKENGAEGFGGAIYNDGEMEQEGTLAIKDNNAKNGGGMVLSGDESVTLGSGVAITSNVATESGGGIYADGHYLELDGITVQGNTATYHGGGLYIERGSNVWTKGSVTFSQNTATRYNGGGIYAEGTLNALYNDSISLLGNSAGGNGGGVYVNGGECDVEIDNGTFDGNTAMRGGGLFVGNGQALLDSATFEKNESQDGGAIALLGGTLKLTGDTKISGNSASSYGGGVCVSDGKLSVDDCIKVTGNSADRKGNDLYLSQGKTLAIMNALDNDAEIGIYLGPGTGFVTSNYAEKHGDADPQEYFTPEKGYRALLRDGEVYLTNCWRELQDAIDAAEDGATIRLEYDAVAFEGDTRLTIPENRTITIDLDGHEIDRSMAGASSSADDGSAFYVPAGSQLTLTDSCETKGSVTGGNATQGGGVLNEGTLVLDGATISGNRAGSGGGVYNVGTLDVKSGAIADNTSTLGGGICSMDGTTTVSGGEISGNGNASTMEGGGICVMGGTAVITGGRIMGNSATRGGGVVVATPMGATTPSVLSVEGVPYVVNNNATQVGNDVYLCDDIKVTMTGQLSDDARIGVTLGTDDGTGTITSDYGEYNRGVNPSRFFVGDAGLWARLTDDGNEAEFRETTTYRVVIDEAAAGKVSADREWAPKGATVTLYEAEDGAWPYYKFGDQYGFMAAEKVGESTFAFTMPELSENDCVTVYQTYEVGVNASEGVNDLTIENTLSAPGEGGAFSYYQFPGSEVRISFDLEEGAELDELSYTYTEDGREVTKALSSTLDGRHASASFEMPASAVTVKAISEDTPDFDAIEYYMSIALKDSIDVNLYVQKLPEGTEPGDYTVRYRVGDGQERVATLASMASNYVNLATLTARQMSEPIRVEVYHVSQDEPIKVVEDCGIRRYCDDKLDNPDTPEKLGALCQAALDYGTMAQLHFGYLTDDLANANHGDGTEAAIAATTVPREFAASGEAPSAEFSQRVRSVSGSVSLESRVTVNLYVKPAAGTTAEDIAVTVGGVEAGTTDAVSRRTLGDGRVLVQVTGIAARNLDKRLEVEVSAGGASRAIGYAPLSYAYSKQGVARDRLGDTCKALYNYWKEASEYLG